MKLTYSQLQDVAKTFGWNTNVAPELQQFIIGTYTESDGSVWTLKYYNDHDRDLWSIIRLLPADHPGTRLYSLGGRSFQEFMQYFKNMQDFHDRTPHPTKNN